MLHWTLRSLMADKVSVAVAGLGIMLALILGLYLDAVFRGEARQIVVFIERMPGQVWVLQDGVENLHMARSQLSDDAVAAVARVPGVASATAIVYGGLSVGDPARERIAYVVGIPNDATLRARWRAATGWPMPDGDGIVLPEPMAKELNLRVGDEIRVGDGRHRVSALSQAAFSMANPLVFMDDRHARRELDAADGASIVLVDPGPGVTAAELAKRIEAESDKVRALTREQLRGNDYVLALQMGGALIGMLTIIATVVSALIVSFTAYAFVSARTGELAVAKALGAPQRQLLAAAILQTSVVAAVGCVLAVAVIGPMEAVLTAWVPGVAVDFSYRTALRLSGATVAVAVAAALVPAVYVLRVDPALVFKG